MKEEEISETPLELLEAGIKIHEKLKTEAESFEGTAFSLPFSSVRNFKPLKYWFNEERTVNLFTNDWKWS